MTATINKQEELMIAKANVRSCEGRLNSIKTSMQIFGVDQHLIERAKEAERQLNNAVEYLDTLTFTHKLDYLFE